VPSLPHSLTHNRVICLLPKLIATRVFLLLHYSGITSDHFACCKVGCKVATKLHLFFFPLLLHLFITSELNCLLQSCNLVFFCCTHSDQSMCLSQNWNFYFLLVALVYHIKAKLQALELTSETDCSSSVV
jgi:hypothetical protein